MRLFKAAFANSSPAAQIVSRLGSAAADERLLKRLMATCWADTPATARTLLFLAVGWAGSLALLWLAFAHYRWASWLGLIYVIGSFASAVASLPLAAPSLPKAPLPGLQALWYVCLLGWTPALGAAWYLQDATNKDSVTVLHRIMLGLLATSLFALWMSATDLFGKIGVQLPIQEAPFASCGPPLFLASSILWIGLVYNCPLPGSRGLSVEQSLHPIFRVVYWILVALWLVSYIRVLATPPGGLEASRGGADAEAAWSKCTVCKLDRPRRCRHCSKCGTCVLKMDHHCPWLRRCIGHDNYKYFVVLLFYSASGLVYKAVTLVPFAVILFQNQAAELWTLVVVAFTGLLIVVLGLLIVTFLGFHLFLIGTARTTIEFLIRHDKARASKHDYDTGVYKNIQAVLGNNPLLWFLPIWPPDSDGFNFEGRVIEEFEHLMEIPSAGAEPREELLSDDGGREKHASSRRDSRVEPSCVQITEDTTCIDDHKEECLQAADDEDSNLPSLLRSKSELEVIKMPAGYHKN